MGKMFILRRRIPNVRDRTATRQDLAIFPVSELEEAVAILTKIGGQLKSDTKLIDSYLGSDGGTCYEVKFDIQAVIDSKAWEGIGPHKDDLYYRRFQMKLDGSVISIEFRRSDGRIENEYFLVEKPTLS